MDNPKSAKITQVHKDEAARLSKLFKERVTVSQAQFAHDHGLGSQGNLSHYLGARSPLNLVAALKFAVGLKCQLSAFSERLDKELSDLLGLVSELPKPDDEKIIRLPWPEDSVFTKAVKILQGESEEGRKLALALMDLARTLAGFQLYTSGRVERNTYRVAEVLTCFINAERCADPQAWCHAITDNACARHGQQKGGGLSIAFMMAQAQAGAPPTIPPSAGFFLH